MNASLFVCTAQWAVLRVECMVVVGGRGTWPGESELASQAEGVFGC